jgi:thiamine-phosphate pyrophosphorylase
VFRLYFISDSTLTPSEPPAQPLLEAIRAGVEMVQIREKSLGAGRVLDLCRDVVAAAADRTEVYVNGRFDIARASGAGGVHLPVSGLPVSDVRRAAGTDLRIGCSTHSIPQALAAEAAGADFIVFGPVYQTPSKAKYGPPVGLGALEKVLTSVRIPVYAIGGIKPGNIGPIAALPVAGAAVISAIATARDRAAAVNMLRAAARRARGEDS